MRTSKEMADEVWRRVDEIERKEAITKRRVYSVVAVATCLAVVVGLSFAMPYFLVSDVDTNNGPYVATLFSDSSFGGYLFVAVVAFVLGAGVTLFCVKTGKKK